MSRPALVVELCIAAAVATIALVFASLGLVTLIAVAVVVLSACSFLIQTVARRRRRRRDRRG